MMVSDHKLRGKIAVVIPCYNEATAISQVVHDFHRVLPMTDVHVFDNNSNDSTADNASEAGAIVHFVKMPGKGNVVRRMFADIEADIYIMVDGDATYDTASAPQMVQKLIDEDLDMVVGCRTEESTDNSNYRRGHRLGNKLLTRSVQRIFRGDFTDMLSGYRVFSRRFVKSFTAESCRFETETELTVHTLEMRLPYGEVNTPYRERAAGSQSKLSTYKDGFRILMMIVRLYSTERPREFWGLIGGFLLAVSLILVVPILVEFSQTHLVPRFPTLFLAIALAICGFLSFTVGLILRTVTHGRKEMKHLAYLMTPSTRSLLGEKKTD